MRPAPMIKTALSGIRAPRGKFVSRDADTRCMQDSDSGNTADQSPIISEFADDADMIELIDLFVAELKQRVEQIQAAFESSDTDTLRTLTHQLKGSGGGYGFPMLTACAAAVEQQIMSGACDTVALGRSVDELIELCKRVKA
jgi:HPt (histidine-containing phosphotransfer) domain-containing protein